jgi:hypothetical protein
MWQAAMLVIRVLILALSSSPWTNLQPRLLGPFVNTGSALRIAVWMQS